ncbi:MAG: dihydrofolate reductase family protein [Acidimicrobiales bacterium]
MGGGDVIRQCVRNGLIDELRIDLAPVILGAGTPPRSRCIWPSWDRFFPCQRRLNR